MSSRQHPSRSLDGLGLEVTYWTFHWACVYFNLEILCAGSTTSKRIEGPAVRPDPLGEQQQGRKPYSIETFHQREATTPPASPRLSWAISSPAVAVVIASFGPDSDCGLGLSPSSAAKGLPVKVVAIVGTPFGKRQAGRESARQRGHPALDRVPMAPIGQTFDNPANRSMADLPPHYSAPLLHTAEVERHVERSVVGRFKREQLRGKGCTRWGGLADSTARRNERMIHSLTGYDIDTSVNRLDSLASSRPQVEPAPLPRVPIASEGGDQI
jgi:hypothetical protein